MTPYKVLSECLLILRFVTLVTPLPPRWNESSLEYSVVPEELPASTASRESLTTDANNQESSYALLKDIECDACKSMIRIIQRLFRLNKTEQFIANEAKDLCIELKIQDTRICTGIILEFKNEVLTVFDEVGLNPDQVCGLVLGPSCYKVRDLYPDWNVTFPDVPKPPVTDIPLPKVSILSCHLKFPQNESVL